MATQPGGSMTSRATSESRAVPGGSGGPHHDSATVTGAKFRHGLLQLMIHTIDPMHDGMHFNAPIFYFKCLIDTFIFLYKVCTHSDVTTPKSI